MDTRSDLNLRQFVVFKLGNIEYGIEIQKVITIEELKTITRIPRTPCYIRGVINLRGDIVPVMDLRCRFNLPLVDDNEEMRIVIIKIEEALFGIIVDGVDEVLNLQEDSFESISNFSNDITMDYILGVGKMDNRIITLLNIDKFAKLEDNL